MKIKRIISLGVQSLLLLSISLNTIGQTHKPIETEKFNETEIVKVIEKNISEEDLSYIVQNRLSSEKDIVKKVEQIQTKINQAINKTYGEKKLSEINDWMKDNIFNSTSVPYKVNYAIPSSIIKKFSDTRKNDSSSANASIKKDNDQCFVTMNLSVDNNGRFFESSELTFRSLEDISNMTQEKLQHIIKETAHHEIAHCELAQKIKNNDDFSLKFSSDKFSTEVAQENAQEIKLIQEKLNEKIQNVIKNIKEGKLEDINQLDYILYINFQENYSDIMQAFKLLGDNPTSEHIKQVQMETIDTVYNFRMSNNNLLTHQTGFTVEKTILNLEQAAKLNNSEREDLALEMASTYLVKNMHRMFIKMSQNKFENMAAFINGHAKWESDGSISISQNPSEKTIQALDSLVGEEYLMSHTTDSLKDFVLKQYQESTIKTTQQQNKVFSLNMDKIKKTKQQNQQDQSNKNIISYSMSFS